MTKYKQLADRFTHIMSYYFLLDGYVLSLIGEVKIYLDLINI